MLKTKTYIRWLTTNLILMKLRLSKCFGIAVDLKFFFYFNALNNKQNCYSKLGELTEL